MDTYDLGWLRHATISTKLYDVKCIDNDVFEEEDLEDVAYYERCANFLSTCVPSPELIHQIQSIVIDVMKETKTDIDNTWDRESVTRDVEESLEARIRESDRKIGFILVVFMKEAFEAHDPKWQALHSNTIESLREIFFAILDMICSAPCPSVRDINTFKKRRSTKNFLAQVSIYAWHNVLLDSTSLFDINEFINVFRKLAMVDCFEEEWYDVLDAFSDRCNCDIERTNEDDEIQQKFIDVRRVQEALSTPTISEEDYQEYGGLIPVFDDQYHDKLVNRGFGNQIDMMNFMID